MDRRTKGRLAEAKVLTHFVAQGFEVYLPFTQNALYDMIVNGEERLQRVSVKYTSTPTPAGNGWIVALRNVSRRNAGQVVVKLFDSSTVDLLAVYIGPEDRVAILSCDFKNTSAIQIPERCRSLV